MYIIKARFIAAEEGIVREKGNLVSFPELELAQLWGRANMEGNLYLASWEPITIEDAKRQGFDV